MAKKKVGGWGVGSVFLLPLSDGDFCLGQIVGREAEVLNSVSVALFDKKLHPSEVDNVSRLHSEDIFSVIFTTREMLDSGRWPVVGDASVSIGADDLPFEELRVDGFIGAKVYGSGIVQRFADAFFGLAPWNDFKDPHYLDALLFSEAKQPRSRVLKNVEL